MILQVVVVANPSLQSYLMRVPVWVKGPPQTHTESAASLRIHFSPTPPNKGIYFSFLYLRYNTNSTNFPWSLLYFCQPTHVFCTCCFHFTSSTPPFGARDARRHARLLLLRGHPTKGHPTKGHPTNWFRSRRRRRLYSHLGLTDFFRANFPYSEVQDT